MCELSPKATGHERETHPHQTRNKTAENLYAHDQNSTAAGHLPCKRRTSRPKESPSRHQRDEVIPDAKPTQIARNLKPTSYQYFSSVLNDEMFALSSDEATRCMAPFIRGIYLSGLSLTA